MVSELTDRPDLRRIWAPNSPLILALTLCLAASAIALAAPIGETRYRLEGVRSYSSAATLSLADGEHLVRCGEIFQRVAIHPYDSPPFGLIEFGLAMSRAVDVEIYDGTPRVLEQEGTLWTPEGDTRVRLSESDLRSWYSMATAGEFLVCGGSTGSFATLRPDRSGDLVIAELVDSLPATSSWHMAGDRYGGFYFEHGGLRSARIDSAGHVELGKTYEARLVSAIESSPALDHLYAAHDDQIVLYRVEEAGALTRVGSLQERDTRGLWRMSVWFDPDRRIDRVAVAYPYDSLFVFEVDESGASSLLLADFIGRGWPQALFLESGRLYYANGFDRAWLLEGPSLELRREMPLDQPFGPLDLSVAPSGDGWAEIGGTPIRPMVVAYGTGTGAGFAAPGRRRLIENGNRIAINDTHVYANRSNDQGPSLLVFERGDSLALVDSVSVSPTFASMPWTIERGLLVTENAVFDLADPAHPELLGEFSDVQRAELQRGATRPFPGSETDLLVVGQTWWYSDSLWFFRISRQGGIEKINSEPRTGGLALDDSRDLLYRSERGDGDPSIAVYDISDPYQPVRIHEQTIVEAGPADRHVQTMTSMDGILHVGLCNGGWPENFRSELVPLWFDGARFVPAGVSLHVPWFSTGTSGQAGYLTMVLGGATALLTYDPPPLPRREECYFGDGWPPSR
ncbi:MAG: hypothetical protein CME06_18335 [Gemmatimonadetes bacterium]|nr:hypothetical protein [Gemmatimonadota bacterium]